VDFSVKNCWDCPIPLWNLLLQFALLYLAGAYGGWSLNMRRAGMRDLGVLIVALTILWAAAVTWTVPRWGILRSEASVDVFLERTTYAIFAALDVGLLAVIVVARRLTLKEP
jgi:hypothetical protein